MDIQYNVPIEDVFSAYYDCCKHKRNKIGALSFEVDLENNLIQLWDDLRTKKYRILPSTVFVVEKPVKREIFAANFRDRIVHHLLLMYLNPYFEKYFIYDSYSCRVGKGTHFGIKRVNHFIHKCSENSKSKCWILKLDVQSFFMSIDKRILYNRLIDFVNSYYKEPNIDFVKYLITIILWNNPTENCIFHSPKSKWADLKFGKSLFDVDLNHGLPIGNYTSQVFANFYLSQLDHYLKHEKKIEFYGRYVDDMVLVHKNKDVLLKSIPKIRRFLKEKLNLELHPKKISLQPAYNGFLFLGAYVLPYRMYPSRRIVKNFKESMRGNYLPKKQKELEKSYLGLFSHFDAYKLSQKIIFNYKPQGATL